LTPQTLERFARRFGREVAVLHSALSAGVRYAQWERIRRGEARVVVGARSALFAPLARPGVIILDEEHEPAYKQEESPRYLAREVARWRARQEGAVLVLGSATPAVETYYYATQGRYRLLTLPERIARRPLPEVTVVDMRAELAAGNRSIFSRNLAQALEETVGRREQAILFLNRRGYSTFVLCRQCGLVASCPRCELALTLHQDSGRLVCHHCGYTALPYRTCPRCGSRYIRDFGCGTERVAAAAAQLLPAARILRLDGDTTVRRGAHDRILSSFAAHEADVLVGTQMVAKGLDFARVSLVGIISADLALHLPDPYAWERTFQLLEQVAGRTGRGEAPGRVILQTYNPAHTSIVCAGRHDYAGFYRAELARRRRHHYPPFAEVVLVRALAPSEEAARRLLEELMARLAAGAVEVEGPAPCPFPKTGDDYRWQAIFKGTDLGELRRRLAVEVPELNAGWRRQGARLSVDVDPMSYL
jgi:primosomal protein N' (replication factor Y)